MGRNARNNGTGADHHGGKPAFVATQEQRDLVLVLAGVGYPHEQIAKRIRWADGREISRDTLRKTFADELRHGMELANAKVANALFTMATKDKIPAAAIFWLKCRAGWREPAQDVNLNYTYGELVEAATKGVKPGPALHVVKGGKA